MPSTFVSGLEADVGAGDDVTVRPPEGEAWCITEVSSDAVFVAGFAGGNQPNVAIQIVDADAAHAPCLVVQDPTAAPEKGLRAKEIYITHDCWMEITNTGAAGSEIGWTGYRVSPENVISYIETVPNADTVDIRPPPGEVWRITEIGAETHGAALHPRLTFAIIDAAFPLLVNTVLLVETEDLKQQKLLNWYISHDVYLQILDTAGADSEVAIIGERVDVEQVGAVEDVDGAGGTPYMDIQPPDGDQWVITEITAETWAVLAPAVPPNSSPDIDISLIVGADLSEFAEGGSASVTLPSIIGDRAMALQIDHDTFIRVTDLSGGDNEVAYLGYVYRRYNPP